MALGSAPPRTERSSIGYFICEPGEELTQGHHRVRVISCVNLQDYRLRGRYEAVGFKIALQD